jgi:pimeloyl-ACP methyl ester carboxylesterase
MGRVVSAGTETLSGAGVLDRWSGRQRSGGAEVGIAAADHRRRPDAVRQWIADARLVTTEFMIASDTPGIELHVRNKRPAAEARRALLMVHGSTFPSEIVFDLKFAGISWMECIAACGYDVYILDIRGYGGSTRPVEMTGPPADHPPIARTETALADVAAAVAFIRSRTGGAKLDLLGWSWGTTLMGWYAARHGEEVDKLVLFAPQWLGVPPGGAIAEGALGAYRVLSEDAVRMVRAERSGPDRMPPDWAALWLDAAFATDPWGAAQSPRLLRAPNGTRQDMRDFWHAGIPLYDPGAIAVPVLVVHGEQDHDLPSAMTAAYFQRLTGTPYKRWVEIGDATHDVFMERHRFQLFDAVQCFLDEDYQPE